jgi:hypothetical protein
MLVPDRVFQPSLLFVRKAKCLPESGTPAKDKHSSLLQKCVNYRLKIFKSLVPSVMFAGNTRDHVHNTSFCLLLANELNKLECYIRQAGKTYPGQNALAYLAHL